MSLSPGCFLLSLVGPFPMHSTSTIPGKSFPQKTRFLQSLQPPTISNLWPRQPVSGCARCDLSRAPGKSSPGGIDLHFMRENAASLSSPALSLLLTGDLSSNPRAGSLPPPAASCAQPLIKWESSARRCPNELICLPALRPPPQDSTPPAVLRLLFWALTISPDYLSSFENSLQEADHN